MKTYIDSVLEEFDLLINDRELELDFYGHITTLPIPETLKDVCKKFLKQKLQEALDQQKEDLIKKLVLNLKEVFENWAADSQYVTGSWNEGDEIQDKHKGDKFWELYARSAWEQFAHLLDERMGGVDIDNLNDFVSKQDLIKKFEGEKSNGLGHDVPDDIIRFVEGVRTMAGSWRKGHNKALDRAIEIIKETE